MGRRLAIGLGRVFWCLTGGFWARGVVQDGTCSRYLMTSTIGAGSAAQRIRLAVAGFPGAGEFRFNRLKSSCGAADSRVLGQVGEGALGAGRNPLMVVGKA